MATTKRGNTGGGGRGGGAGGKGGGAKGSGERRDRPTMRSSHEARPKRGAAPKGLSIGPRTRKARPAPRAETAAAPGASLASDEARELAVAIAIAALDKKASGLEILDVAGKVDYADFLVLMTGRSDRQVAALAQGIEDALRKKNRRPLSVEGMQKASWVLMDFGDVVVHVFQDDARSNYDIDSLWLDARRVPVPLPAGAREREEDGERSTT